MLMCCYSCTLGTKLSGQLEEPAALYPGDVTPNTSRVEVCVLSRMLRRKISSALREPNRDIPGNLNHMIKSL